MPLMSMIMNLHYILQVIFCWRY